MNRLFNRLFNILIFMTTFSVTVGATSPIAFNVSFKEPQAHYAEITMHIPDVHADYVDVKMPVWAPGSYLVREFSKNVEGVMAMDLDNKPLKCHKISKNTWRIYTNKQQHIQVNYRVYAFEVSVRTSFIDASHAFLSPTGVFMFVEGELSRPAVVNIEPHAAWKKVSTGLEPIRGKVWSYSAANFDILFDSPIEIGNQDVFSFTAAGVLHEVAMYGGGNYDKNRLKVDMATIVEQATAVYGENPNERYVFIVHNFQSGGGGLEHLNSTVLGASRFNYENPSGYRSFLSLVAHEYFHLWNIKRLRPEALGPFDYDRENYTTDLWIGEGFTAYYDNLLVKRAGFNTEDGYLQALTDDVEAVENRPGNQIQPLSEASFDAWIKYYRPNENAVNSQVSYYSKGALMAMMIDLKILHATQGKKGLDDVMREAYQVFYKKADKGYSDQAFKELAERVSGVSLDDVYALVNRAGTPDYNAYLNLVGISLENMNEGIETPDIGIKTTQSDGKLIVQQVLRDGGAWHAGINVKDELIAVNGYRIDANGRELERVIQTSAIGQSITFIIARDGLIKEIKVEVGNSQTGRYTLIPLADATNEQLVLRKQWLSKR